MTVMTRNPEVVQAEAISELTKRLEALLALDAEARVPLGAAQDFVRWMVREGWRPVGRRVEADDPNRPGEDAPPPPSYAEAKAALLARASVQP